MAITAVSTTALALLNSDVDPMPVHSIYASGVNLRCGEYLIHASERPHGGASSLGMTARDLEVLCREPSWEWTADALVSQDRRRFIGLAEAVDRYPTSPPSAPVISRATPGRLVHARARAGRHGWFDSGLGLSVGVARLRRAIHALAGGQPDAVEHLRGVVGLGAGLTPAADDALVGALCLLSAAGMVSVDLRGDMGVWLREEGVGATTDVSRSYLCLAVEGAFSAPINRVVGCLAEDVGQAELDESVLALGGLGATSGMDTALGIQIACELLAGPTQDPDHLTGESCE